jgi:hypothetical protein
MRLQDLVHVVAIEQDDTTENIFRDLAVIRGDQTFGHAEAGWLWEDGQRVVRLTPDFEIQARFMRFECIGHYPISCLFFSESLHELEGAILESYFNAFTSYTCAFVDGQLRRFECTYRDAQGLGRVFDKQGQVERDGFGGDYRERRLRWLP